MYSRVAFAAASIFLAATLGACSSGSGASGGTSLDAALSRVANAYGTHSQIAYDDTSYLVKLSGTSLGTTKGFATLRGLGAPALAGLSANLTSDTGVSLFKEDYAITAGIPPKMVSLLHGGQSGSLVTSHMIKLGWKQNGGTLVGPAEPGGGSPNAAFYALSMHTVRSAGSDLTFGQSGGNLSEIGTPKGSTLASDPLISALASCLGDVVAAQIGVGNSDFGGRHPAAVAVGVRKPASDSAKPRAVACVAWSSQAKAAKYTTDARKALTSGVSLATNQPYSKLLSQPSVTDIGGSQHVVQWQADTTSRADLIFEMYERTDLPGLPDCPRLPAAARSRVAGCS
jgi:hypothetical protein